MTELLDPGLRARFDAAVPVPEMDDAAVGSLLRRGRRRRRARQVGVGVAAVAVVAALSVGGMSLLNRRPAPPAVPQPETPVDAVLWLSSDRVRPGAEVVGVLVDETGASHVFDQLASVERWVGAAWVDAGEPLLWCLPADPCSAEVMEPGTAVDFQPVEIAPAPGEPGPAMRMSTAGLEPGRYRITHTSRAGTTASGVLEVAEDAPEGAPLPPLDGSALDVRPSLTSAAGGSPVVLRPVDRDGRDAELAALPGMARIELWRDGAWAPVGEVALAGYPGDESAQLFVVPPLAAGEYRVLREGPDGDAWGRFWVLDTMVISAPAEVLETYVGLPDGREAPGDTAVVFGNGDETLTVSLPGTGACVAVPVGTEVSAPLVTIVLREAAQVCEPDGTHTTYVLALPDGAPPVPEMTIRTEGGGDDPYARLRLWLTDVVAETGIQPAPGLVSEAGRYALVGVWPREVVAVVAELADEADQAAGVTVTGTAELEGLTLETGTDATGAAAARLTCGGLVLSFLGRNDTPEAFEDVRSVAEAVVRVARPCPVNADAITVQ